jgi:hypothetical protein
MVEALFESLPAKSRDEFFDPFVDLLNAGQVGCDFLDRTIEMEVDLVGMQRTLIDSRPQYRCASSVALLTHLTCHVCNLGVGANTVNEATLFRVSNVSSVILSKYVRLVSVEYLNSIVKPILAFIASIDGSFEVCRACLLASRSPDAHWRMQLTLGLYAIAPVARSSDTRAIRRRC